MSRVLFWIAAALCLAPLFPLPKALEGIVAPGALILGIAIALSVGNPYAAQTKKSSRTILQAAVVCLGFSMDFASVAKAGLNGLGFSLISITGVFLLGWGLCKVLKVRPITSLLVSVGTAICGGSAIAAVSSVVEAPEEDVSVAMGAVFLLNAVALIVFPPIGHLLSLTQTQFGTWAGIAIHDIASVAGAGTAYGPVALDTATAVKLSRVLYLVPITLIAAAWHHAASKRDAPEAKRAIQVPWFIGLFLIASGLRNVLPVVAAHAPDIKKVASAGFAIALFLIGLGISRKTLKAVGARPLVQGFILWIAISVAAVLAVRI